MEIVYVEEGQCLAHHGIKGQKWYVRRFQNSDGTLTEAGKKRYSTSGSTNKIERTESGIKSLVNDEFKKTFPNKKSLEDERKRFRKWNEAEQAWYENTDDSKRSALRAKADKLGEKDPYYKMEQDLVAEFKKQYPDYNEKDYDMLFNAMQNTFDINIWTPALNKKDKAGSTGSSKITDALIDVGKDVTKAVLTKTLIG